MFTLFSPGGSGKAPSSGLARRFLPFLGGQTDMDTAQSSKVKEKIYVMKNKTFYYIW